MVDVSSLVTSTNQLGTMRAMVASLLDRLAAKPDCLGLGVLGGAAIGGSREFVDEFSDIDISLLISVPGAAAFAHLPWHRFVHAIEPQLPAWLPNFKFHVPDSGLEINIHQHIWERESQDHIRWDDEKCEAYAETLEIVHDPDARLADLVARKVADRRDREFAATVDLLSYSRNLVADGVTKCVRRGVPESAIDVIDLVLDRMLDVLFFTCGRWPPHPKWRMPALRDMARTDGLAAQGHLLVTRWRQRDLDITAAQVAILAVIDAVEVRARARFGDEWPADVYNHAVTEHFPDRQLCLTTAADRRAAASCYAKRLTNETWNRTNWQLEHADVPTCRNVITYR